MLRVCLGVTAEIKLASDTYTSLFPEVEQEVAAVRRVSSPAP